jgi:hypothetical protein
LDLRGKVNLKVLFVPFAVCPKSHASRNFKGKYFISVIGNVQVAVPSGNTGLLSPQQVDGLTQFLCIRCTNAFKLVELCIQQGGRILATHVVIMQS